MVAFTKVAPLYPNTDKKKQNIGVGEVPLIDGGFLQFHHVSKNKEIKWNRVFGYRNTDFQPSGSKQAVILVFRIGKGPGSRVITPPNFLITSAVL